MKSGIKAKSEYFVKTVSGLWLKGCIDLVDGELKLYWQRRVQYHPDGTAVCIDADGKEYSKLLRGSNKVIDDESWVMYLSKSIDVLPRISKKYDLMEYYRSLLMHCLYCTVEGVGESIHTISWLLDDVSACLYLIDGDYVLSKDAGNLAGCTARYDGVLKVDIGEETHSLELDDWSDYVMWLCPKIF